MILSPSRWWTLQKGIGFKAVFRITDKPSVHSSGYHIAFDLTEPRYGKLNFMLPTWVGPDYLPSSQAAQECPHLGSELRLPKWKTAIHLPLRQNATDSESKSAYEFKKCVKQPPCSVSPIISSWALSDAKLQQCRIRLTLP